MITVLNLIAVPLDEFGDPLPDSQTWRIVSEISIRLGEHEVGRIGHGGVIQRDGVFQVEESVAFWLARSLNQ